MQIEFRISQIENNGKSTNLPTIYPDYPAAEGAIKDLPAGAYQIQKIYVQKTILGSDEFLSNYGWEAYHNPSGEYWYVIGIDLKKGSVCAGGWPPSIGNLEDFTKWKRLKPLTEDELNYRKKKFGTNWE